eukprot:CAMPEP_0181176076 /NCGR_PEP_ID=MMETSP1096-20121128/4430_1 /TAXON_ID=156174 ORGANISM="Chrysochromulina ericina, Strain CCMP281" /NCGR_SAMPLE_ID=MMETSP1096 /ASSEMBLY_ACC=CAM_ASM_000453 /LENGTH=134 /DNA_ID=CAMNT_0023264127 /DNA_START=1029 /DNA_END=1430 /DNA_ORIENTATION=+
MAPALKRSRAKADQRSRGPSCSCGSYGAMRTTSCLPCSHMMRLTRSPLCRGKLEWYCPPKCNTPWPIGRDAKSSSCAAICVGSSSMKRTPAGGMQRGTHAFEADGAAREAWYTQVGVEGDYGGVRVFRKGDVLT